MCGCRGGSRTAEIKDKILENNYHILGKGWGMGHSEGENKFQEVLCYKEYQTWRVKRQWELKKVSGTLNSRFRRVLGTGIMLSKSRPWGWWGSRGSEWRTAEQAWWGVAGGREAQSVLGLCK